MDTINETELITTLKKELTKQLPKHYNTTNNQFPTATKHGIPILTIKKQNTPTHYIKTTTNQTEILIIPNAHKWDPDTFEYLCLTAENELQTTEYNHDATIIPLADPNLIETIITTILQ